MQNSTRQMYISHNLRHAGPRVLEAAYWHTPSESGTCAPLPSHTIYAPEPDRMKDALKNKLISIMAGVTISQMDTWLDSSTTDCPSDAEHYYGYIYLLSSLKETDTRGNAVVNPTSEDCHSILMSFWKSHFLLNRRNGTSIF